MNVKKSESIGQTESSRKGNVDFFLGEYEVYREKVGSIDSYAQISHAINEQLAKGVTTLLDIGNGGVFDYDTKLVKEITGLDLFLEDLPKEIKLPYNVRMVQGSALDIPKDLLNYDAVIMVMLLHHLVGPTVDECFKNLSNALFEANKSLASGGKIIIVESCVPQWFFDFECLVYKPASRFIERFMRHPATLQYTKSQIVGALGGAGFMKIESFEIPKGKYVLQYGVKFPTWLTPVYPVIFTAEKV